MMNNFKGIYLSPPKNKLHIFEPFLVCRNTLKVYSLFLVAWTNYYCFMLAKDLRVNNFS